MTSPTSSDRGRAGFTLMELLVVLAILSVLLGVAVGAFGRGVPRRDLARNALLDHLRRARLFAVAEQAPAVVRLDPGDDESWPTLTALGRRTVGLWHLEGTDLGGYPQAAASTGAEEHPRGALGRAVQLRDDEHSYLDFGTSPSYESVQGMAAELFVNLDLERGRTLVQKGESFRLSVDQEGFLSLTVTTRQRGEDGRMTSAGHAVESEGPCLFPGRWTKVAASFDGLALRLYVDDAQVGEAVLLDWAALQPSPQEPVVVGSYEGSFAGAVDEFRWAIYVAEESEPLDGMRVISQERMVRFSPGGELDTRFHAGPAELGLEADGGARVWVTVGILGDVNG